MHENSDRILQILGGYIVIIHFYLPMTARLFPCLPYLDAVKFRIDEKVLTLRTLELNGHRTHQSVPRHPFANPSTICSIPTIADTDSNRLRTGIPIDRGQHSDDCGQELPSTASWVHMTRVRVKLATVGSRFFGLPEARHRPRSQ